MYFSQLTSVPNRVKNIKSIILCQNPSEFEERSLLEIASIQKEIDSYFETIQHDFDLTLEKYIQESKKLTLFHKKRYGYLTKVSEKKLDAIEKELNRISNQLYELGAMLKEISSQISNKY